MTDARNPSEAAVSVEPKSGGFSLGLEADALRIREGWKLDDPCAPMAIGFTAQGGERVLRIISGALLMLFGVSAWVIAAGFIQGPMAYWSNPFGAEALQLQALITGAAALVIGAITGAFGLAEHRRRDKLRNT